MRLLIIVLFFYGSWAFSSEVSSLEADSGFEKKEDDPEILSLSRYFPTYAAYGNPTSKLQFSFKYQLAYDFPMYFGYTQKMFWNLRESSEPLNDVNYNPELFYKLKLNWEILPSVDLSPYSHLSNGRDGADSRSLTRGFVRLNFLVPSEKRKISIATTFFSNYGSKGDNRDVEKYLGPLDFRISVSQFVPWMFDQGQLTYRFFPGGRYANRWDMGGNEIGLNFRLGHIGLKPSLYLQYYSGYAESLLNYNQHEDHFMFGIML